MLTGIVKQRDETIAVLELDLTVSKTKLIEATTVVQSIAALSKSLASTASRGEMVRGEADPMLMQTSMELFAANKALMARDAQLHALQVTRRVLASAKCWNNMQQVVGYELMRHELSFFISWIFVSFHMISTSANVVGISLSLLLQTVSLI